MRMYHLIKPLCLILLISILSNPFSYTLLASKQMENNQTHIQFIGIPGLSQHNLQLTQNQKNTLQNIINESKKSLQNLEKNDSIQVITNTLDNLLQIKILTERQHEKTSRTISILQKIYTNIRFKNICYLNTQNSTNLFCFLIGEASITKFVNLVELGCTGLTYLLIIVYFLANFIGLGDTLYTYISLIRQLHSNYQNVRPSVFPSIGVLSFGIRHPSPSPPNQLKTYPSEGWIRSSGFLGQTYINGSYIGHMRSLKSPLYEYLTYFLGATGFIGINIEQNNRKNYFLGFSLGLKTIYWPQPPYP